MKVVNAYCKRGFTLIELLIVIAIIAILAAILFPVFAKAREKAKQATCTNNLKTLAMATSLYAEDYDEACMPVNCKNGDAAWPQILTSLAPSYLSIAKGSFTKLQCPSNLHKYYYKGTEYKQDWSNYAYNSKLGSVAKVVYLSQITSPSTTLQFVDASDYLITPDTGSNIAFVHADGANIAWMDGHISWAAKGTPKISYASSSWISITQ